MRKQKFLITTAAILALAAPSFAADMDGPIVVPAQDEYQPVEVGSGWYIRGDVSYNLGKPTYDFSLFGEDTTAHRLGGGVGFGYHFTDNFRSDVTLSYLAGDKYEYDDGVDRVSAAHDVYNLMVGGYWDIATVGGLTPYVGAGIGATYSKHVISVDAPSIPLVGTLSDRQYNLAYSLMAGASYKVTDTVSIDAGYQFVHTPNMEYLNTRTGLIDQGVQQHLLKVGVRYDLW